MSAGFIFGFLCTEDGWRDSRGRFDCGCAFRWRTEDVIVVVGSIVLVDAGCGRWIMPQI
jgi:hypothetical protein